MVTRGLPGYGYVWITRVRCSVACHARVAVGYGYALPLFQLVYGLRAVAVRAFTRVTQLFILVTVTFRWLFDYTLLIGTLVTFTVVYALRIAFYV